MKKSSFLIAIAALVCTSTTILHAEPPKRELLPDKTAPIGAWDMVPFQRFNGKFNVGVVAFHETGLSVAFSVNGEKRPVVEEPTFNPQANVWEYWIELDATKLPAGEVTLGALLKPKGEGHLEKELDPLILYSDPKGDLAGETVYVDAKNGSDDTADGSEKKPFQSLAKAVVAAGDGGTVLMKPGEYVPNFVEGRNEQRAYWTILSPALGVERDDVVIMPGRPFTNKICFRNLSMCAVEGNSWILQGSGRGNIIWVDNCRMWTQEPLRGNLLNAQTDRLYVTGGVTEKMQNGPDSSDTFIKDHLMKDIAEDSFRNRVTAINCTIDGVDAGRFTGIYHPDFFQPRVGQEIETEGVIMYNVRALRSRQQIFSFRDIINSAFVNVLADTPDDGSPELSQFAQRLHHVLIWNVVLHRQPIYFRDDSRWKNPLDFRGTYMENMIVDREIFGGEAETTHRDVMLQNILVGRKRPTWEALFAPRNLIVGTPAFEAPEAGDFRLVPSSPGYRQGVALPGVPADINGVPFDPAHPDLGCFSTAQPKK